MKMLIQDKYVAAQFMSIELNISKDDLKKRYLVLVREYHPDVSKLPNATELLQKLNDAYNLLKEIVPLNIAPRTDIGPRDPYYTDLVNRMKGMSGFGFGFDSNFFEEMMRYNQRPKEDEDVKFFSKDDIERANRAAKNEKERFRQASQRAERMKEESYTFSNKDIDFEASRKAWNDKFNQPPPKQETNGDWKRSQAGNMYKNDILNNRTIVFICKTGKNVNKYKVMKVFTDGNKVYYDEVFESEDMAIIYADQMY